jgi:hypothetical protein
MESIVHSKKKALAIGILHGMESRVTDTEKTSTNFTFCHWAVGEPQADPHWVGECEFSKINISITQISDSERLARSVRVPPKAPETYYQVLLPGDLGFWPRRRYPATKEWNMAPSTPSSCSRSNVKKRAHAGKRPRSPDEGIDDLPVFDCNNFRIWESRIRLLLRSRNLLSLIEKPLDENADESTKSKACQVCCILSNAITDQVFTSIITSENSNMEDPHAIWSELKQIYASNSTLEIFGARSKWQNIEYNHDLNKYLNEVEQCLAEFHFIGLEVPDPILACCIVARLSQKSAVLKEALLVDLLTNSKTHKIIQKLRLMSRLEVATK